MRLYKVKKMTFRFIKFGYNIFYISKNITYFHPKLITSSIKYHNITHGIGNFNSEICALNSCILKPFKLSYITHCYYAKGKDKKRSDKGSQKKKIVLCDEDVSEIIQINTMRSSMEQAVSNLKQDFLKHLSLRSTTDNILKRTLVVTQ
uniref:Uncharacterized protein n=2 Tax=Clastoptera arizonana TaxID=38151 RepID=A0A1B6D140_9HEMI